MRAEVRGRDREWKVFYSDEAALVSPVPMFDRDGVLQGVISAGAPSDTGGMTEAHGVFDSPQQAEEFARFLGATEINVKKVLTKSESLARARATRQKGSAA